MTDLVTLNRGGGGKRKSDPPMNFPEPSLWNSQFGRRAFLKKTGAATAGAAIALHGLRMEVLASGSGGPHCARPLAVVGEIVYYTKSWTMPAAEYGINALIFSGHIEGDDMTFLEKEEYLHDSGFTCNPAQGAVPNTYPLLENSCVNGTDPIANPQWVMTAPQFGTPSAPDAYGNITVVVTLSGQLRTATPRACPPQ